ncbi:carbohydrate ABC transporter permease [Streptomyces sp. NPDC058464]|uniref:carbohydrate ABC transporter permease n=1 Tax=Streptomyces sp. NPDC058464 TaxID=3346511 RepID=UPI00364BCF3B
MIARYTWRTGLLEAVLVLTALLFLVPLYALVNISLKPANATSGLLTPTLHLHLSNYADAWHTAALGPALWNSFLITAGSLLILIPIAALASYPLARVTRAWSRLTFYGIAAGLILPMQLALLPLYTNIRDLGLLGTPWSLIVYYAGLTFPFSVFLYTGFLRALPIEYEEAAVMDGCGPLRAFVSVVFPLLRPVTGTVVILNAIGIWNDFFAPLLFLSGTDSQTAPVALYSFVGQYVSQWPMVFAGLVVSVIPVLVAYLFLQKYIIQGFAGGLKG